MHRKYIRGYQGLKEEGKRGVLLNGFRVYIWGEDKVLKIVMMVVQYCKRN